MDGIRADESQQGSRFGGSGLGNLLQIDEAATLRHCRMDMNIGFQLGRLLEPLEEEGSTRKASRGSSEERFRVSSTKTSADGDLSLEEYLVICRTHLDYPEADLQFASTLYEIVNDGGGMGVHVDKLQGHPRLVTMAHSFSLEYHIQMLLNFQVVSMHILSCQHLIH